jgi:hypothetical protein
MASFIVHGPFKVGYRKRRGGRTLVFGSFWSAESDAQYLAKECGCYVFAIRAGPGLQPIYVGIATRSFKQETFTSANRHKYHNGFSKYAKGTPLMLFVVHPPQTGPRNVREIEEIEDFLIQAGVAKNSDLQNVHGAQQPTWSIKGVIRSEAGRRSRAEAEFARLFDLRD